MSDTETATTETATEPTENSQATGQGETQPVEQKTPEGNVEAQKPTEEVVDRDARLASANKREARKLADAQKQRDLVEQHAKLQQDLEGVKWLLGDKVDPMQVLVELEKRGLRFEDLGQAFVERATRKPIDQINDVAKRLDELEEKTSKESTARLRAHADSVASAFISDVKAFVENDPDTYEFILAEPDAMRDIVSLTQTYIAKENEWPDPRKVVAVLEKHYAQENEDKLERLSKTKKLGSKFVPKKADDEGSKDAGTKQSFTIGEQSSVAGGSSPKEYETDSDKERQRVMKVFEDYRRRVQQKNPARTNT